MHEDLWYIRRMTPSLVLDETIRACLASPIDFCNSGNKEDPSDYIREHAPGFRRTVRDILEVAGGPHGDILEIGSFLGIVSITLARIGFSVTATEIPEFAENEALRERYRVAGINLVPVNLRGYRLPFSSETFDVVVMCETLEHLNFNPLPVILEINRVLKPKGIFYLAVPNIARLQNLVFLLLGRSIHNPIRDFYSQLEYRGSGIVGLHWREYTRKEIREMLEGMGFSVERQYYFARRPRWFPLIPIYTMFPRVRPNVTTIARKVVLPTLRFRFCDATR